MRKPSPVGFGAYLYFKDLFLRCYYWEMNQSITHKHLRSVMMDDKGRTYYEFPEEMALPMVRFLKQKEFMEWMGSGLDGETLTAITEQAKTSLMDALKLTSDSTAFSKKMAQVFVMLDEIGNRQSKIIPFDLVINCLCALVVREDEDPMEWNEAIHQEKCQYFAQHQASYQFFFRFTAFRGLSKLLVDSSENWSKYLAQSIVQLKGLRESLKNYSTDNKSSKAEKKV